MKNDRILVFFFFLWTIIAIKHTSRLELTIQATKWLFSAHLVQVLFLRLKIVISHKKFELYQTSDSTSPQDMKYDRLLAWIYQFKISETNQNTTKRALNNNDFKTVKAEQKSKFQRKITSYAQNHFDAVFDILRNVLRFCQKKGWSNKKLKYTRRATSKRKKKSREKTVKNRWKKKNGDIERRYTYRMAWKCREGFERGRNGESKEWMYGSTLGGRKWKYIKKHDLGHFFLLALP